ncbi:hypothetical protein NLS1_04280 [Nocardioides sp. LS1]|nr:hypothetical protein NLS1_04280 [Nocardioides sp. LS1]
MESGRPAERGRGDALGRTTRPAQPLALDDPGQVVGEAEVVVLEVVVVVGAHADMTPAPPVRPLWTAQVAPVNESVTDGQL